MDRRRRPRPYHQRDTGAPHTPPFEPELADDCEWAYVVDLDTQILEVYGSSEEKRKDHRFHDVGGPDKRVPKFLLRVPFSDMNSYTKKKDFGSTFEKEAMEKLETWVSE